MFTKKDLKVGMYGVDRYGTKFKVEETRLRYEDDTVIPLSYFNDDLTMNDKNGMYSEEEDIMKIVDSDCFEDIDYYIEKNVCILFDRETV